MLTRDYHLGSTQLIPEATEVHFKVAEVDQKTAKRSLGMVFMLVRDYQLGSTQLIPEATEVHFKVAEVDQKTAKHSSPSHQLAPH